MLLEGSLKKDGKYWLVDLPAIDGMTFGHSKKEALSMAEDYLNLMVEEELGKKTRFHVHSVDGDNFKVKPSDPDILPALILKRQRLKNEMTIQDVVDVLGLHSKNSYAVYEQGRHIPGLNKFQELLKAINRKTELVLKLL